MPAFAPIVLMDGKDTPLAHTFDLVRTSNGKTQMANRSAIIPLARENLNVELKQPSGANGAQRVITTFGAPIAVTDPGGATKIDHVNSFELTFNWSVYATDSEKKDVYAQLQSLLDNAGFREVVIEHEPYYGS